MGKSESTMRKYFIDKTAIVAKSAKIGDNSKIWAFAQIADNAVIGKNCMIGNGVYIDRNVIVGDNVKIHNKALLYNGLTVENNCFIGPGVCFTNDKFPKHNTTRNLVGKTWRVKEGASIGANSTILPEVTIGKNVVIGVGSVVTKSIPDNATAYGNPAKIVKIPATKICATNISASADLCGGGGSAMSFGGNKNAETVNLKERLRSTSNWILNSGLQSKNGGFYAWFDLNTKKYSYLYSEITGYGITTLLFLNKVSQNKEIIKKAELAADWIIKESLHDCGGVRTRKYLHSQKDKLYSFDRENIFTFDTGTVLYGMANLFKATKNNLYLETSKKIANFLLNNQKKDGSIAPVYNPKTNKTVETFDKWSNQRGAFHAKIALGLVDLYEITKDKLYKNAAIELCEFALSMQDESGRFITNKVDNTTHIHPHSYAAEGLLYAGAYFRIKEFIGAARRSTQWSYQNLYSYGINEIYNPNTNTFNDFQRSDILAQVLRLGIIFSLDSKKIEELALLLLGYQYKTPAKGKKNKQIGGFFYSKDGFHLNSWCSMFALQALAIYNNKISAKNHGGSAFGGKKIKLDLFI